MWKRNTERKNAITTAEFLKSIVVNVSHHILSFARHENNTKSEQYCKKGPGRKAKIGKQEYVPSEQEYSPFRRYYDIDGVRVTRW